MVCDTGCSRVSRRDQLAARGQEGHTGLFPHRHGGTATRGNGRHVLGAQNHPGLRQKRTGPHVCPAGLDVGSFGDPTILCKHHAARFREGDLLNHDYRVEPVVKVVAGIRPHIVLAQLPTAGVRKALRKVRRTNGDAVHGGGPHHRQIVLGVLVLGQHPPGGVYQGNRLHLRSRVPFVKQTSQSLLLWNPLRRIRAHNDLLLKRKSICKCLDLQMHSISRRLKALRVLFEIMLAQLPPAVNEKF